MKVHFLIVDTSCDKFQFLFKVTLTEVSLLPLKSLERAHHQAFLVWEHLLVLSCTYCLFFFSYLVLKSFICVFSLLCLPGFTSFVTGSKLKKSLLLNLPLLFLTKKSLFLKS